jgi:glycosyltransferase 2 family protein
VSARAPWQRLALPRWLALLLQVLVSVGLLAALVAVVDWSDLRDAAVALSPAWLVAVFLLCFCAQAMLVLRWRALMDMLGVRESWMRSWHTVFASFFLINFLPGTLGADGLRVVLLTKSCGRASTAVGAVAYERLMQLALYVLLVAAAALTPMDWLQPWLRVIIVIGGTSAVLLIVYILYWLGQRSVDRPLARGGLLQAAWRLFATILTETGRMQTRMRRHRRASLGFWLASILNVSMIFAMWCLILDELGYAISIPTIVLITGIVAIVTVVPVSLNGLGIFEGSVVTLLGLAAVQPAHAFLLALIVRAAFMTVSFVGLPSVALLWRERRPRRFV